MVKGQLNICMEKIKFKSYYIWIINVSVKAKTIKLLEENTGEKLCDLGMGKDF